MSEVNGWRYNDFMRHLLVWVLALGLCMSSARAQPVVFPKLLSYRELAFREGPLEEVSFSKDAVALAKAMSLGESRPDGDFELRIARIDPMTGEGIAYLIANRRFRSYRVHGLSDGHIRAVPMKSRRIGPDRLPVSELQALKGISGRWFSCGGPDGETILIDASVGGAAVRMWAGSPRECGTRHGDRTDALLKSVELLNGPM